MRLWDYQLLKETDTVALDMSMPMEDRTELLWNWWPHMTLYEHKARGITICAVVPTVPQMCSQQRLTKVARLSALLGLGESIACLDETPRQGRTHAF